MTELIQFIQEMGHASIDLFWWPLLLWTGLALVMAVTLKHTSRLSAVYHYHFRIAVLAALPAGILAAPVLQALLQSSEGTVSTALFVVQNPIAVSTPTMVQAGFNWASPSFWIGIVTLLAGFVALAALVKLMVNFIQLKQFTNRLKDEAERSWEQYFNIKVFISDDNIKVFISDDIEVPFTFGWVEKKIVLPAKLKDEPQKYRMALRHELTHVQNKDYVINSFTQCIKALFFFHPIVHYFTNKANEYREIYCDLNVLTDRRISQKRYASLLYELSSKPLFKQKTAVNMAVNPSTLKKRIQIMKKQANITPSFRQSILVTLLLGLILTGFMACSDITNDGLTVNEVKKVQQKAANTNVIPIEDQPLYILNGEILDPEQRSLVSRLKTKYIKSVEVLKGEAAVEAYGEAGKNGVIKIQVYNKEKALNDLLPPPPQIPNKPNKPSAPQEAPNNVYMAVNDMPELKNQKAFYSHFKYPKKCKEAGVEGTVYVQFVVTKTGEVTNVEVIKGIGHGCDQAAANWVTQYASFTPGTQNGEPVKVRYTLPVRYTLK